MKKYLFFAMAITLTMAVDAQEAVTLNIGNISLEAGGKRMSLKITSDVAITDFCSYQFDLLLPNNIEMPYEEEESGYGFYSYDEEADEYVFKAAYSSTITTANHSFDVSAIEGGYRFICKSGQLTPFKNGKTGVLTVQLIATDKAVNGTYPIRLGGIQKFSIADESGAHSIVPSVNPGTCTITGGAATTTIPFSMAEAGWGTLILPFNAEIPSGLTAYECSQSTNDGEVNWLELEKAQSMTANTPYILSGVAGDYNFTGTPNFEQTSYTEGMLTGVYVATAIDHGYVLQKQEDEVAFFKVPNGKTKTVPAYRCYLNDQPSGAIMFRIGGATQIEQAIKDTEPGDGFIYDLQGRRCNDDLQPGLYIRNNQLFYVK